MIINATMIGAEIANNTNISNPPPILHILAPGANDTTEISVFQDDLYIGVASRIDIELFEFVLPITYNTHKYLVSENSGQLKNSEFLTLLPQVVPYRPLNKVMHFDFSTNSLGIVQQPIIDLTNSIICEKVISNIAPTIIDQDSVLKLPSLDFEVYDGSFGKVLQLFTQGDTTKSPITISGNFTILVVGNMNSKISGYNRGIFNLTEDGYPANATSGASDSPVISQNDLIVLNINYPTQTFQLVSSVVGQTASKSVIANSNNPIINSSNYYTYAFRALAGDVLSNSTTWINGNIVNNTIDTNVSEAIWESFTFNYLGGLGYVIATSGTIGEILIFNDLLTDLEVQAILTSFNIKWKA